VEACPAKSKTEARHKSINLEPALEHREEERARWDFFLSIPELDRGLLPHNTVKGAAVLEPLFEFSGACAGCGETPYLKLLSQLFGDRLLVANATGCSSIYGGNLPTTPWASNAQGRGPAWANSLFEDNAEFGMGIRLGAEAQQRAARDLLTSLAPAVGEELAGEILAAAGAQDEEAVFAQRRRVGQLQARLATLASSGDADVAAQAQRLVVLADALVRKSVWIVGGDGWAYDIGFGGLDHVLGSGRDVNVLVLDTEVYSNTGGQASKSTQRGAVAKYAANGKATAKKDLGAIARSYGNVYVAQIAIGANDVQTIKALLEADAHPGPSLVVAYSTCIAHGIDMATSMTHQKDAVRSGYWPLYRFRPTEDPTGQPFTLDSREPDVSVADFVSTEVRYAALARSHPERAKELLGLLSGDAAERWRFYTQLAGLHRTVVHDTGQPGDAEDGQAATPDGEEAE
jgi:pyruvate-ferredoxin/flavodoxin oxidoreductase